MAILDDFKTRFPEFDSNQVDSYWPALESAWPVYYKFPYDSSTKEVVLNLIAHLFVGETNGESGQVRAVQSQTVGPVSLTFAATAELSGTEAFWGATKYGQRFWMLASRRRGAVFV